MNKYEDPTQRLSSKGWSKEYKENFSEIFGVKYRFYYSDNTQDTHRFKNKEEAMFFIHNEGDHLIGYIEL
jgi:hypothetical protein